MRSIKLIIKVLRNALTLTFIRQSFSFLVEFSIENAYALRVMDRGKNTPVSASARFFNPGNIKLGNRSNVNYNCILIAGKKSKIVFGEDCVMGPGVKIIATYQQPDVLTINQTCHITEGDIIIGNNVWLGANVVVLPGVKIGNGAIVGSGSIVTQDIESYTVMIENPVRMLKSR